MLRFGGNSLKEGQRRSILRMIVDQFSDFMVLVLIGSALIAGSRRARGYYRNCGDCYTKCNSWFCSRIQGRKSHGSSEDSCNDSSEGVAIWGN
ncbi:MAG: hypothetical protein IPK04_02335 [Bdellovibrionales bacterium]|nr:hypothetical protein [Bdellovibrionales bacterium]